MVLPGRILAGSSFRTRSHQVMQLLTRKHPKRFESGISIPDLREKSSSAEKLSDSQLIDVANRLRGSFHQDPDDVDATEWGFAISLEAIRRTLGMRLYDVQILAAEALAGGNVAELATGEGKTLSASPAAMLGALRGHTVHVVTPNDYLAGRDFEQLRPAFESLGISVGLLPENVPAGQKQAAYRCEVTYGTGYEFGFDYLRDRLALQQCHSLPLGTRLLEKLEGTAAPVEQIQGDHGIAIIDEVDNILIDEASSPLILSEGTDEEAVDAVAVRMAHDLAAELDPDSHFTVKGPAVNLTSDGHAFVHAPTLAIPASQLRRPWSEYVHQALRARLLFQLDAHYVVEEGKVQIVDGSTGRIFSDRTWSDGLHQAVEAREGLKITAERGALQQITRQRYFQLYECLCGMTGTANGCEQEFREVFDMGTIPIPRRLPCRRIVNPIRTFASADAKWSAIAAEVLTRQNAGQPVLIGTRTIAASETLATQLQSHRIPFQLLNGRQDAEEADIISRAGQSGRVTIATNLAGRGTDIKLDEASLTAGGMHVIVSEPHELARVDRQLVGRCSRQGDPGSTTTFVSAEDHLIRQYAPWLEKPIRRSSNRQDEVSFDLGSRIARIQSEIARRQSAARMELLRRDVNRESLISEIG